MSSKAARNIYGEGRGRGKDKGRERCYNRGRGQGRGRGSHKDVSLDWASDTLLEFGMSLAGVHSAFVTCLLKNYMGLVAVMEHKKESLGEGKTAFIENILERCRKCAENSFQEVREPILFITGSAQRCEWYDGLTRLLSDVYTKGMHACDDLMSFSTLESVNTYLSKKTPSSLRIQYGVLQQSVGALLEDARARSRPNNSGGGAAANDQSTYLYDGQVALYQSIKNDILPMVCLPEKDGYLLHNKSLSSMRNGKPDFTTEMRDLPPLQVSHPIDASHGWVHVLNHFLLLRADCAISLRFSLSEIYDAYLKARVKSRLQPGTPVPFWSVRKELQIAKEQTRSGGRRVKAYWNVRYKSVSFNPYNGVVYIMALDETPKGKKGFMNDNMIALSPEFFNPNNTCYVGIIRSVPSPKDDKQKSKPPTNAVFAFELIETLGPRKAFSAVASAGTRFTVVESPVFYSAYRASLKTLGRHVIDALKTSDPAWPTSVGFPLEAALFGGHTNDAPAYIRQLTIHDPEGGAKLNLEASIETKAGVPPVVDPLRKESWSEVCAEWTEAQELAVGERAGRDPAARFRHIIDSTQRAALQHIFSHRIAVVQGTPGTGKSFVGFKFIQILLENEKNLHMGPIVITALTNHAIDAVMENLLEYLKVSGTPVHEGDVLRVGSGKTTAAELAGCIFPKEVVRASREVFKICDLVKEKSDALTKPVYMRMKKAMPALEAFTDAILLGALRRALPNVKNTPANWVRRKELLDTHDRLQSDLAKLSDNEGIRRAVSASLIVESLKPYFQNIDEDKAEACLKELSAAVPYLRYNNSDVFRLWLSGGHSEQKNAKDIPEIISLLRAGASLPVPPAIADALKKAKDTVPKNANAKDTSRRPQPQASYEEADTTSEEEEPHNSADDSDYDDRRGVADDTEAFGVVELVDESDQHVAALEALANAVVAGCATVQQWLALPTADRSMITDAFSVKGQNELLKTMRSIEQSNDTPKVLDASNESIARSKAEVMRRAKIIGGTVNGLLKEERALSLLKPRVLMVEEAAEVLEGHLLGMLTPALEHLVLIGDHRQLPPAPEEFELATKKHLDVSLQERLVRSGAEYETLTTQRRMHPDVSRLIHSYYLRAENSYDVPVQILDHPSTRSRPVPRGVADGARTLLIDYEANDTRRERTDDSVGSFWNTYEVDLCACIAKHLSLYNPGKTIILLTYYSQQRFKLSEAIGKNFPLLKVRTVDDFQGEEEDFVILSTVRTERPGFVTKENRACVALSRAKMGCYIVGCTALLERTCTLLHDVVQLLKLQGQVVRSFPACCPMHNKNMTFSTKEEYVKQVCREQCSFVAPCGHRCEQKCHGPEHNKCLKTPCGRTGSLCTPPRPCDHACQHVCWQKCGPCDVPCEVECPDCRCRREVTCHESLVGPLSPCTNTVRVQAGMAACKHSFNAPCSALVALSGGRLPRADLSERYCREKCGATMPCGHTCTAPCHYGKDDSHERYAANCKVNVRCPHPRCGHVVKVECSANRADPNIYPKCREACGKSLKCGHNCQLRCGHFDECFCEEMVTKTCERCGHSVTSKCVLASRHHCQQPCAFQFPPPCGHKCAGTCGTCSRRGHVPCATCQLLADDLLAQQSDIILKSEIQRVASARQFQRVGIGFFRGQQPAPFPPSSPPVSNHSLPQPANAQGGSTPGVLSRPHSTLSAAPAPVAPSATRSSSSASSDTHTSRVPPDTTAAAPSSTATLPALPTASEPRRPTVAERASLASHARTTAPLTGDLPEYFWEPEYSDWTKRMQRLAAEDSLDPNELRLFTNREVEFLNLKKFLCGVLRVRGVAFTCSVPAGGEWTAADGESIALMQKVRPHLLGSSDTNRVQTALAELNLSDNADVPLIKLLKALAYSTAPLIRDYLDDAEDALLDYTSLYREAEAPATPLMVGATMLVAARIAVARGDASGGAASCFFRLAKNAFYKDWLHPKKESHVPLPTESGAAASTAAAINVDERNDPWNELKNLLKPYPEAWKTIKELRKMTGLGTVKDQVRKVCITTLREMQLPKEKRAPQTINFVLQGNPGTGKTTVARLLGKLLFQMGVRKSDTFIETTGEEMARKGAAAADTTFQSADGGVLFIDEAYALEPSKGGENAAIGLQLLMAAENSRETLTIILAGYKDDLQSKLFAFNDGFQRRFPSEFTITFEDYTDDELASIFRGILAERKWSASEDVVRVAARRVGRGRGRKGFGNAGAVRALFEAAYRNALDSIPVGAPPPSDLSLTMVDVIGPRPTGDSPPDLKAALKELDDMVGLRRVKDSIHELVELAKNNYDLEVEGKEPQFRTMNRVLLGNPGTGKTTVAKLYGRILKGLGWLSKGQWELKQPADIIGSHVGETEKNMAALLASCEGKVLIIDEAYQFNENKQYGDAAISTLVSKVHGTAGEDIAVVLIGYDKQMQDMMRACNPGLKRRFDLANAFVFEDYSDAELDLILKRAVGRRGKKLSEPTRLRVVRSIAMQRNTPNFGNAGVVQQAVESAVTRSVARDFRATELTLADFNISDDPPDVEGALKLLDGMYKTEHIVEHIRKLAQRIIQCDREGQSRSVCVANYVFTGAPGTGKTTVARVMGKVLNLLGCISSDKVVMTSGQNLLGSYIGQTKDQVNKQMDDAQGGILFVDEAYSLCESCGGFGQEAVSALVDLMTSPQHLSQTVVIVAGYPDAMKKLMKMNEGLRSRFKQQLHFPDWDANDCIDYLHQTLIKKDILLGDGEDEHDEALKELRISLTEAQNRLGWGNARTCNMLLSNLQDSRAQRLDGNKEKPKKYTLGDVRSACQDLLAQLPERKKDARPSPEAKTGFPSATAFATATRELPRTAETLTEKPQLEELLEEKEEVAECEDGGEDAFFTALLAACKAAGYDSSHERRKVLIGILKSVQATGAPFPPDILDPVVRQTGAAVGEVMAKLRPQIATVLLGMRNAVAAEERFLEELRLLDEAAKAARVAEREAVRQRLRALCPAGYEWFECPGGGWRCGGGSHFVTEDQLPTLPV